MNQVAPRSVVESCAHRRRSRRCARQRGLTLIETLVAVAVLTIGVVGIAGGVAATQKVAAVSQNESQLELTMRQFSDWVRTSSSSSCTNAACPNLPYSVCAQPSTYGSAITSAVAAGALTPPTGVTRSIQAISLSTAASRSSGGVATTMPPVPGGTCFSTTCPGASCIGDWGVQEITLRVSSGANSVTRVVWKSESW